MKWAQVVPLRSRDQPSAGGGEPGGGRGLPPQVVPVLLQRPQALPRSLPRRLAHKREGEEKSAGLLDWEEAPAPYDVVVNSEDAWVLSQWEAANAEARGTASALAPYQAEIAAAAAAVNGPAPLLLHLGLTHGCGIETASPSRPNPSPTSS